MPAPRVLYGTVDLLHLSIASRWDSNQWTADLMVLRTEIPTNWAKLELQKALKITLKILPTEKKSAEKKSL